MLPQRQECHGAERSPPYMPAPCVKNVCTLPVSINSSLQISILSIVCPLSRSGPRMTGGLSWLPPTITSVWESLATEGQTLSIKTQGRTSGWVPQWFLGVGLDTRWIGFGILTSVSDFWDLRMALQTVWHIATQPTFTSLSDIQDLQ